MSFPVKTCTVCGRRGVAGTTRCELHWAPRHSPRHQYQTAEYRRHRRQVLERAAGRCEACGEPTGDTTQVDHIVPIRDGGDNSLANLRALCRDCHRQKTQLDRERRR